MPPKAPKGSTLDLARKAQKRRGASAASSTSSGISFHTNPHQEIITHVDRTITSAGHIVARTSQFAVQTSRPVKRQKVDGPTPLTGSTTQSPPVEPPKRNQVPTQHFVSSSADGSPLLPKIDMDNTPNSEFSRLLEDYMDRAWRFSTKHSVNPIPWAEIGNDSTQFVVPQRLPPTVVFKKPSEMLGAHVHELYLHILDTQDKNSSIPPKNRFQFVAHGPDFADSSGSPGEVLPAATPRPEAPPSLPNPPTGSGTHLESVPPVPISQYPTVGPSPTNTAQMPTAPPNPRLSIILPARVAANMSKTPTTMEKHAASPIPRFTVAGRASAGSVTLVPLPTGIARGRKWQAPSTGAEHPPQSKRAKTCPKSDLGEVLEGKRHRKLTEKGHAYIETRTAARRGGKSSRGGAR